MHRLPQGTGDRPITPPGDGDRDNRPFDLPRDGHAQRSRAGPAATLRRRSRPTTAPDAALDDDRADRARDARRRGRPARRERCPGAASTGSPSPRDSRRRHRVRRAADDIGRRPGLQPDRSGRCCSALLGIAAAAGAGHRPGAPSAAAAARGRGHGAPRRRAAAGHRRDRARRARARTGSPTRTPRSARSARPSTRCSAHVESSLDARHESEQQVRQFVADASHELRTPLTTIAGLRRARAGAGPTTPITTRTALDKVEAESARMTSLVEDLLLLARLDAGRRSSARRRPLPAPRRGRLRRAGRRPGHRWQLDLPDEPIEVDRRRAAAPPGGHQPADQRPQAHPGRHDGHRRPRQPRRVRRARRRARASRRAWPSTPSSGSPAATRPAPAATPAAPASACRSCRRS